MSSHPTLTEFAHNSWGGSSTNTDTYAQVQFVSLQSFVVD